MNTVKSDAVDKVVMDETSGFFFNGEEAVGTDRRHEALPFALGFLDRSRRPGGAVSIRAHNRAAAHIGLISKLLLNERSEPVGLAV